MQVMPATAANLLISIPNVAHLESRSVITQAAFGVAANGGAKSRQTSNGCCRKRSLEDLGTRKALGPPLETSVGLNDFKRQQVGQ